MQDEKLAQGSVTQDTEAKEEEEEEEKHRRRHVTIRVQKEHANDIVMKIKRDVRLGRMMLVYCDHLRLEAAALRFSFEGRRVQEWDTPEGIGLEDGDIIDVWSDMSGGGGGGVISL